MLQNRVDILSTRNIDNVLIQNALSKNIVIDVISFIKTEPVLTSESLKEVQEASAKSGAVTFTSSNAVEAIATSPDLLKTNFFGRKIFFGVFILFSIIVAAYRPPNLFFFNLKTILL